MPQEDLRPNSGEFSELQMDMLERFWNRKTAKVIAAEIGCSEGWVNKNLQFVRKQLGVNSTSEAAAIVFGSKPGGTKNYYYQETEVPSLGYGSDQAQALPDMRMFGRATGEQALINRMGPVASLAAILLVALGAIMGVTLLIAGAEGMNQLWKALGY